ncbi:MAG: efflux transporter periplasmic adaptor subunit [Ponticaulis sp.]|nr:efflux transporter periplasmic adaptor subunit [Ponticaulis sp.]
MKSVQIRARKTSAVSVSIVSALLLTMTACSGGEPESTGAPAGRPAAPAISVSTVRMVPQTVQSVRELTGRARAYQEAEIRPQVTGLIQTRLFTEGQQVKAGDPLYQIDAAEYRAAVQSAEASLAGAEASFAEAKETAERFRRLAEINAVSQQDYDSAVATAKRAEANIGISKAALARARIDLQRTTVRSPIDGQIGRSSVTPGALVTANQATSLARVLQLNPIYVDMTAASSEVLKWKQDVAQGRIRTMSDDGVGRVAVTIKLENGMEMPEEGQLGFSEVNVDENAGTVIVRAVVPNDDTLLLPGMFVSANFPAGLYENIFLVPQRAVQRDQRGEPYVFIVGPENKAALREISILESNGPNWIVTSGLTEGDQLITGGLQSVREGASVNASTASSTDQAASLPVATTE